MVGVGYRVVAQWIPKVCSRPYWKVHPESKLVRLSDPVHDEEVAARLGASRWHSLRPAGALGKSGACVGNCAPSAMLRRKESVMHVCGGEKLGQGRHLQGHMAS